MKKTFNLRFFTSLTADIHTNDVDLIDVKDKKQAIWFFFTSRIWLFWTTWSIICWMFIVTLKKSNQCILSSGLACKCWSLIKTTLDTWNDDGPLIEYVRELSLMNRGVCMSSRSTCDTRTVWDLKSFLIFFVFISF